MKIGIITMHRVINYGSILQAYALQRKVHELGVENEIIDYLYPTIKRKTFREQLQFCKHKLLDSLYGFPRLKKKKRFKKFYHNNLRVTQETFDRKTIFNNPPIFDAYISGSDQVWNPKFINNDPAFLLSFVPNNKERSSFSSSFAINKIPQEYEYIYKEELSKFKNITVREKSGISIVKTLTNKDAKLVCDPTLLLEKEEWEKFAEYSEIKISEKYILVYALGYMYNPFPQIYDIIDSVAKEFGNIKVVYLDGNKNDLLRKNSKIIKDAGPNEFIYLFKNAEFVITTSFHGTAFSVMLGKPFYSVVKSFDSIDGRMPTLLKELGCSSSLISYDSEKKESKEQLLLKRCHSNELEEFRIKSIDILNDILDDFQKI